MLSDERLLDFCRALSDTVRSGLPLSAAFETLSRSPGYGRFIAAAGEMTARGSSIHEALKAAGVFPPVFLALLRAGEEGGKAAEFLDMYADCLEVRVDFRRRILRALLYPAFAVAASGALFALLSLKTIPFLLGHLADAGIALPAASSPLENAAGKLAGRWPLLGLSLCLLALAFRAVSRSGPARKLWALTGHRLPGFRFAAAEARLHHIYTTTGLLLKAGIAPGAMMDILLEFAGDDFVLRRRFLRTAAMLSDGKSFSESFGACAPPQDRPSLELAEKAGRLDETLLLLGRSHRDRHFHRLKLLADGCRLAAIAAIVLLSCAMTFLRLRPLLSVLDGAQDFSRALPALTAPLVRPPGNFGTSGPAAPAAVPSGGSVGLRLPNSYVVGDRTALFNNINAGKIAELMQKPAQKISASSSSASNTTPPEKPATKARKLVPVHPAKKFRFQKINPTPVKATEIK